MVVLGGSYFSGVLAGDTRKASRSPADFVNVWAAGRLVLDGHVAAAYDWTKHKAMEVQAVGHAFDDYYGWHYPPPFLFVAAALALIPFLPASIIWLAATLPLYVATIRVIVGDRVGILLALGFPGVVLERHGRTERVSLRSADWRHAGSAGATSYFCRNSVSGC